MVQYTDIISVCGHAQRSRYVSWEKMYWNTYCLHILYNIINQLSTTSKMIPLNSSYHMYCDTYCIATPVSNLHMFFSGCVWCLINLLAEYDTKGGARCLVAANGQLGAGFAGHQEGSWAEHLLKIVYGRGLVVISCVCVCVYKRVYKRHY